MLTIICSILQIESMNNKNTGESEQRIFATRIAKMILSISWKI